MPRLATCHACHIIQKLPDVHPKTPLVPAILEYTTGERVVMRGDDGLPKMVPAFDPMLEAFVTRHEHGMPESAVTHVRQIEVVSVDRKTWETMDVITKVKEDLQRQTGEVYSENDEYRKGALECYNAHGNPDLAKGCSDYLSDSKMIGTWNYTDPDGNTVTIPPKFRQYLCYLCPFSHAYVTVELRRRKGMYQGWEKRGPRKR